MTHLFRWQRPGYGCLRDHRQPNEVTKFSSFGGKQWVKTGDFSSMLEPIKPRLKHITSLFTADSMGFILSMGKLGADSQE
jgi:hypothetical protein